MKHEVYPSIEKVLDKLSMASPVGDSIAPILNGLLQGRLEYFTVWDDLRFAATSINPPGQASDPVWDASLGGWLFDTASVDVLYIIAQLPHAWKEGSTLKPHVHWEKTTSAAGNVLWRLNYYWSEIGKVRSGLNTLTSSTPVISDQDTANLHAITSLGDIDATGKTLSNILVMRIERVGTDGADTYGADARLLEFDIHFEIDSMGSNEVADKTDVV